MKIPNRYKHEYVCCLPTSLEKEIMSEVELSVEKLKIEPEERNCILCDAHNSIVCDLTDTINIEFIQGELMPDFMKEYAHFLENQIKYNGLMKKEVKEVKCTKIENILRCFNENRLMVNESMLCLSKVLNGGW